jgi:signal transduction histidine kinase
VTVTDSGVGIDAGLLPFVFERFRQGDSSTTRTHGGLGIGLALVRHFVELHGGTVSARSDGEGTGSTFLVTLPL